MAAYVDLATLHVPTVGGNPPASWGLQVRDNFDRIANPPRFRIARTTAQSIPTGVTTAVTLNSSQLNAGYSGASSHWTSGTNVTIRDTGEWLVGYEIRMEAAAAGARLFAIDVNAGTSFVAVSEMPAAGSGWLVGQAACAQERFSAGAVLKLVAFQSSGVAVNVGTTQPLRIWGRWIGP